jgi:hypothetical protein
MLHSVDYTIINTDQKLDQYLNTYVHQIQNTKLNEDENLKKLIPTRAGLEILRPEFPLISRPRMDLSAIFSRLHRQRPLKIQYTVTVIEGGHKLRGSIFQIVDDQHPLFQIELKSGNIYAKYVDAAGLHLVKISGLSELKLTIYIQLADDDSGYIYMYNNDDLVVDLPTFKHNSSERPWIQYGIIGAEGGVRGRILVKNVSWLIDSDVHVPKKKVSIVR